MSGKSLPSMPKMPEHVLHEMRHCIHSSIHAGSANMLPDYYCTLQQARGCLCRLYKRGQCSAREPFPESYNA